MLTQEQLAERKGYIGASEAAAVCGLDAYRHPVDVWMEKTGRVDPPDLSDVECVEAGNVFEPAIRGWAAQRLGVKVNQVRQTVYHPDLPFVACHPDGKIVGSGNRAGLEIKNRSVWMRGRYGEPGSDAVLDTDLCQCQHTMAVTGWDLMHMAVVFGGQRLVLFRVPRDDGFIDSLLSGEAEFWKHIETDTVPAIDWMADGSLDVVKRLYPGTDGSTVFLPDRAAELHRERVALVAAIKEAQRIADARTAELRGLLGTAAVGVLPGGLGQYRRKVIEIRESKPREFSRDDFRFSSKVDQYEGNGDV